MDTSKNYEGMFFTAEAQRRREKILFCFNNSAPPTCCTFDRRRSGRLFVFVFLAWAGPALAGGPEDGLAAYNAGDYATALRLCRPLAEQGDAQAQYLLGRMHEKGRGVDRDFSAAARWYRMAAERNHHESQYRLAVAYAYGLGDLAQDDAQAIAWLRRSAEGGYKKAQKRLAQAYEEGRFGLPRDPKLAQYWRDKANAADKASRPAAAKAP